MSKMRSVVQPAKSDTVKIPRYCLHRPTGQGVVYIARREFYCGPYGSSESLALYGQVIERWKAAGPAAVWSDQRQIKKLAADLTVVELVAQFLQWAQRRYVTSPNEMSAFAVATKRLLRLYADTPVSQLGPLALQAVRSAMIADDLCRNVINAAVHRIRRIWKWAVRNELIEETLWRSLCSVFTLAFAFMQTSSRARRRRRSGLGRRRRRQSCGRPGPGRSAPLRRRQMCRGIRRRCG